MWNYPPSRILVPVDFGEASQRAVQIAGALGRRFDAQLELLHVESLEAPAYFTHEQIAVIENELTIARSLADRHVSEFAAPFVAVPFSVRVVRGTPAAAIIEAARSTDLVVMGTHGRRGPSRWWLGSVAERVASETPSPLLVVRAGRPNEDPESVFKRFLVLGTGGPDTEAARYATKLARSFGAEVPPAVATCEADIRRERDASLIVVGRQPQGGGWLGAPEERLLRSCTLSMLFIPAL